MNLEVVYITVGTTKFNKLIENITSDKVLNILRNRKCYKIVLQLGSSSHIKESQSKRIFEIYGIDLQQYSFRPNLEDILNADLIIGHAGAGTCMDILSQGKAGLIVVNDELMGNHQLELAEELAKQGYIFYCNLSEIAEKLEQLDITKLKPYKSATSNMNKFVQSLNELVSS